MEIADLNTATAAELEDHVNQEKRKQAMMLQLISHETGERSEPFIANWQQLKETLDKMEDDQVKPEDYILLVAVMDGEDTRIPRAPLITVEKFLSLGEN